MIFDQDNWQEIFSTIRRNKLRTFLTMLGVFWGIFMLVIMLGSGNGLRNGVLRDFSGSATNSFYTWTQTTSKAYKGMKPDRNFNYNLADVEALKQMPELAEVSPMNQLGGYEEDNNVIRGLKTAACEVQGNYPNCAKIKQIKIAKGRFLNDLDILEKRKICVIGPRVVELLYKKKEEVLGTYIRIKGVYFKVVGITHVESSGGEAREEAQQIQIPFSTFQRAFNYGDVVGWFAIQSKKNVPASVAEAKVLALLKERHKVAPDDQKALGHWNMEEQFNKLNGLFVGIEILIWIVGSGTLLAGVIGISNIMLIVVNERTKEIGVKMALGAVPGQVVSQILLESIFLTAISGYLGLLSGIGILELLNSMLEGGSDTFSNPTVDLSVALKALLILIVGGALAGLVPAKKAVSIRPVEALKNE